jgi:hypothetical protein
MANLHDNLALYHILEAAQALIDEAHLEDDDERANFLGMHANRLRDLASFLYPPAEDWGGANVVRFPVERRG